MYHSNAELVIKGQVVRISITFNDTYACLSNNEELFRVLDEIKSVRDTAVNSRLRNLFDLYNYLKLNNGDRFLCELVPLLPYDGQKKDEFSMTLFLLYIMFIYKVLNDNYVYIINPCVKSFQLEDRIGMIYKKHFIHKSCLHDRTKSLFSPNDCKKKYGYSISGHSPCSMIKTSSLISDHVVYGESLIVNFIDLIIRGVIYDPFCMTCHRFLFDMRSGVTNVPSFKIGLFENIKISYYLDQGRLFDGNYYYLNVYICIYMYIFYRHVL